MPATRPFPLLTVRRMAELTNQPLSVMEELLEEHPELRPMALADYRPVYDRDAFVRVLEVIDQQEAAADA